VFPYKVRSDFIFMYMKLYKNQFYLLLIMNHIFEGN